MSKKGKLDKADMKKIATGAGIAGAGAVLTYLLEIIPNVDFLNGNYITPIIVALLSILVNVVKKISTDTTK